MLEVYGGDQGMTASHGGLTLPTCPTKLSVKMEVTGTEHGFRKSAVDQYSFMAPKYNRNIPFKINTETHWNKKGTSSLTFVSP